MSKAVDFFKGEFGKLLHSEAKPAAYFRPRPYRNAAVKFDQCSIDDIQGRARIVESIGLNVFMFPSDKIPGCDLLSDSGTTTMTMQQWGRMLQGDEAYGSNAGYFELKRHLRGMLGDDWTIKDPWAAGKDDREVIMYLFHQGRAAENALFTALSRLLRRSSESMDALATGPGNIDGLSAELSSRIRVGMEKLRDRHDVDPRRHEIKYIVPNNTHFDTTQDNIEHNVMVPLNLPCAEHAGPEVDETFSFRGNMNTADLQELMEHSSARVPMVYLTITNNAGGGQPVSMENIRQVKRITEKHRIPLMFDACRFAENAWFIKQKEKGYAGRSVSDIVKEMFSYVDGFHISLKKDGLVNIGGAILIKPNGLLTDNYPELLEQLTDHQILVEGHPTYGGLAGRDIMGVVEGLKTVVREDYLEYRTGQVARFGNRLAGYGIPIVKPVGGHAVYIDMNEFFGEDEPRDDEFKGIALTALLLIAGHRLCELGVFAFGRYDKVRKREIPPVPKVNNVRAAVPRLAYEDADLFSVAEAIKVLHDNRDMIPAVEVLSGQEKTLRHFKSRFRFVD